MKPRRIHWSPDMDHLLIQYAQDPFESRRDLANVLGISEGAIRNRERELGIRWNPQDKSGPRNPMWGRKRPDFRQNHWTKVGYDQSGSRNPNWKGGGSLYRGYGWYKNRRLAKERDQRTCQYCGSTERLEVHHIIPWRFSKDNSLDNLVTLCAECHRRTERWVRPLFETALKRGIITEAV